MELKDLDIVLTNIVVLLNPPENPVSISPEELKGVIRAPINVGQTGDGSLYFNSPRDQIDIIVGRRRLQVQDNSGQEPGQKPLPKVALDVLTLLNTTYRAFGLNYKLFFKPEAKKGPASIIADSLLNTDQINTRLNLEISGAGTRLFYPKGSKICTLLIEPEGGVKGERIHVDLNVHEDTTQLPPHDTLHESLKSEYKALIELLKCL